MLALAIYFITAQFLKVFEIGSNCFPLFPAGGRDVSGSAHQERPV